ncbi:MAG: hypothetical protein H7Z13_00610 [Ferruginibacter sp.]|nr:hypothetical protein [Ferruginibacter sp.]
MKTPVLFCILLFFITACVFTWKAESTLGQEFGYIAVIISMAVFSKNIIEKLNA